MSEKAWQLIDQVGWCQGQSVKRKGTTIIGYCVMGAIRVTYGGDRSACWAAIEKMRAVIGEGGLAVWNDAPGQTKEHVIEVMQAVGV